MLSVTFERCREETLICLHLPLSETSSELRSSASLLGRSAILSRRAALGRLAPDSSGELPSPPASLDGPVVVHETFHQTCDPAGETDRLGPRGLARLGSFPGAQPLTASGRPPPSPDAVLQQLRERVQRRSGSSSGDLIAGASRMVADVLGIEEDTVSAFLSANTGLSIPEVHVALAAPFLLNPLTAAALRPLISSDIAQLSPDQSIGARATLLAATTTLAKIPGAIATFLRKLGGQR